MPSIDRGYGYANCRVLDSIAPPARETDEYACSTARLITIYLTIAFAWRVWVFDATISCHVDRTDGTVDPQRSSVVVSPSKSILFLAGLIGIV